MNDLLVVAVITGEPGNPVVITIGAEFDDPVWLVAVFIGGELEDPDWPVIGAALDELDWFN